MSDRMIELPSVWCLPLTFRPKNTGWLLHFHLQNSDKFSFVTDADVEPSEKGIQLSHDVTQHSPRSQSKRGMERKKMLMCKGIIQSMAGTEHFQNDLMLSAK